MKSFANKLAVITGAGTGMGREIARALAREGADLAMCDVIDANLKETLSLCEQEAAQGRRMSIHHCDVANEDQVVEFRDAVVQQHETDHIDLLFNNAGVGGIQSFVNGSREHWERTFNTCWFGVYYCSRAFVPLLVASDEGHMVNTSSVNGFWASLGKGKEHTAYSAAKFAVKGFSEALMEDLAKHAPHVKVSVVMPGHIGTEIAANTMTIVAGEEPDKSSGEWLAAARNRFSSLGVYEEMLSDEQVVEASEALAEEFRNSAPTSAAQAAEIILQGVREERWRILVGEDAKRLDEMVRENPEGAYSDAFLDQMIKEDVLVNLITPADAV